MNEYILRAWYEKKGLIRFTSHRDIINTWYISMSRSRLPVLYTEGFTKKPKIAFSPALSLGVSSDCEFADIYLTRGIDCDSKLIETLNVAFPNGIKFYKTEFVTSGINETIKKISAFEYSFKIFGDFAPAGQIAENVVEKLTKIESLNELTLEYNERKRDVRPYISGFESIGRDNEALSFKMKLALIDSASIKPQLIFSYLSDVLSGFMYSYEINKDRLIFKD